MSNDPLLQPFKLRHLTLRNRIMTTSHEPAYAEDGMPKERYRLYHAERAKGGIAMAMTAGSAAVSRDSPPAFNNILAYKDEVVPWIRELTDAIHEHGAAAMIQLTHLGRRTGWDKGDWLPPVSSTYDREPAHRYFAKMAEDWDITRIIRDFADAAERMKAAGFNEFSTPILTASSPEGARDFLVPSRLQSRHPPPARSPRRAPHSAQRASCTSSPSVR